MKLSRQADISKRRVLAEIPLDTGEFVDIATVSHALIMPGMLNDQLNNSADLGLNRDATSGGR
jgi:hypothetical protein